MPDVMPVLARGRHRTARQGACFMEYASMLAGEKWSDRPTCTHPALAGLARLVNDWTTDSARSRIAPLIPSVIGLTSDDPRIDPLVAMRAAAAALPIASESRQRVIAVGLIHCVGKLTVLDPDDAARVTGIAREALAQVPMAERWARKHLASSRPIADRNLIPLCDSLMSIAVAGIAEACVTDRDLRLSVLLSDVIEECRRVTDGEAHVRASVAARRVTEMKVAEARTPSLIDSIDSRV